MKEKTLFASLLILICSLALIPACFPASTPATSTTSPAAETFSTVNTGIVNIVLKPMGEVDAAIVDGLKSNLEQIFGCRVETVYENYDLEKAYVPARNQYLVDPIFSDLTEYNPPEGEKVLGIVDVDLYAPGLNFLFSQSEISGGTALLSLARLGRQYFFLPAGKTLLLDRATKEAVHTLGHTVGLDDCFDAKCVMHYSNNVSETDNKQAEFCHWCRAKLEK